jgi:nucleoside-diphosphate-sugar epimerase
MRTLIIGGTRFVGALLTWRLVAAGHQVTHFNRGTIADPFGDGIERLHGDRTTEDLPRLLSGRTFDAVVDTAAYTGEDARRAVEVLNGRVGHYVFISTGQVYLVREGANLPAREEDYPGPVKPEPHDPDEHGSWKYGVDKRAAEDALGEAWQTRGFPATCLRIPMVNGERDYFRRIENYLWRILDGGPVLLPDGGANLCRHVYGGEVARALGEVLGRQETFGQAFNLSQEEEVPLSELVARLAALMGAPVRTASVAREAVTGAGLDLREVSPFSGRWMSRLDASRARTELGFRHLPLDEYLGRIVASFLAHPPIDRPGGYERRDLELRLAAPGRRPLLHR